MYTARADKLDQTNDGIVDLDFRLIVSIHDVNYSHFPDVCVEVPDFYAPHQ